jgi:hypothetical protein
VTVTASQIFESLNRYPVHSVERYELLSTAFGALRRGIRRIVTRLSEGDEPESREVADQLRYLLSGWLTIPIPFDGTILESLSFLGDSDAVEKRWGREVRVAYDHACSAALEMQKGENPARHQLIEIFGRLSAEEKAWRIYCHKTATAYYKSLFSGEQSITDLFLHTVTDYRETKPFDVLIKMGPLRPQGWGSVPDAILTAPRFGTLVQIVWAGSADEDGFGYDPVSTPLEVPAASNPIVTQDRECSPRTVVWTRTNVQVGDPLSDTAADYEYDELKYFHELSRGLEMHRATLVQIDEEDGILYPPHSQVAAFDPTLNVEAPFGYKLPGETLNENMFIISPALGAADLGETKAGEGHYSRIWKERLRKEFRYTPNQLLRRLREGGIELRNLRYCVRQWCRPPSTVIHAPQLKRHFEILIGVLNLEEDVNGTESTPLRRPWWEYAWSEIGHARVEAIQTGIQEHEIVYDQFFVILNDLLPEIRNRVLAESIFEVAIPPGRDLQGVVRFYKVLSIEEGFLAPDSFLKVISDLTAIEQWRV